MSTFTRFVFVLALACTACSTAHDPAPTPEPAVADAGPTLVPIPVDPPDRPPALHTPCREGLVRDRNHCAGWSPAGDQRIFCNPTAHALRVDAQLLPDGRVVIQGDCTLGDLGFEQRILEYDPRTDRFTEIFAIPPGGIRTSNGLEGLEHAVDAGNRTTARLDDGSVLLVGGSLWAHPEPPHIYDRAAGIELRTVQQGGWYDLGAAVRLLDGRILFVGYGTEIYTRVRI